MIVRAMKYSEIPACCDLVRANWGAEAADRACGQMIAYFRGGTYAHNSGKYAPQFFVADEGNGVVGFSAYQPSMRMKDAFDLIWIAVHADHQGKNLGTLLTQVRLAEIKKRGGSFVSLVTQKPRFFSKFGFRIVDIHDSWCFMHMKLSKVEI